jgi:hypothetical protein
MRDRNSENFLKARATYDREHPGALKPIRSQFDSPDWEKAQAKAKAQATAPAAQSTGSQAAPVHTPAKGFTDAQRKAVFGYREDNSPVLGSHVERNLKNWIDEVATFTEIGESTAAATKELLLAESERPRSNAELDTEIQVAALGSAWLRLILLHRFRLKSEPELSTATPTWTRK